MGINQQPRGLSYVLVIMTNKYTYYVYESQLEAVERAIAQRDIFKTTDAKSHAKIRLNGEHISSIVEGTIRDV